MDKAELKIKDLKKTLNSLLKLKGFLKSKHRILKFAEIQIKEQFWYLKRKLKKSNHFNLYI